MLAKIAARNIFLPEFWKVSKTKSTKLGPQATIQAKFGWDLWEFQTFGLSLSPVLRYSLESLTRRNIWDTAGYKEFHMPLKALCVLEKGTDAFASRY